jgi:hypothetical protein
MSKRLAGGHSMARGKIYLSLALITLASIVFPVGWQQAKTKIAKVQNVKSTMRKIYEEDQRDRTDEAGDAKHREQVRQLIREGKVQSGEDYYYAAFIFQHGQKASDYLYAHVLAVTAVNKGIHNAMWLSAATLDRYLRSIEQPQVFGTQFGSLTDSRDDQEPYDRGIVSDALREQWCVAPETTQAKILSDMRAGKEFHSTRTRPLPDAQFDVN